MTIVISPKARDDLRETFEYIRKDSPEAADRVLARIVEILGLLASGVMVGREVILRGGQRVHTWSVPPYRIYYRKLRMSFRWSGCTTRRGVQLNDESWYSMRKIYKQKRRSCALCKPHKMGWDKRWKVKESAKMLSMEQEIRKWGE